MGDKCDVEMGFMPSSIYNAVKFQGDTGTVKKNKDKQKLNKEKFRQANVLGIDQGNINKTQRVMSSNLNSKMPPTTSVPEPNINLSREELLKLLSVFEGELQARDEVIEILKTERTNNPALQERYGLSNMPMKALQRDAATLDITTKDRVAEQTKENLQKIIEHQKESYKKLKQALLAAEEANQRLAVEVTEEKRKHQDYMLKSDDFVNLIEDERERLKMALDEEKAINEKREKDVNQKLKVNKEELTKLKSLSLVLVEERQQQVTELSEYKNKAGELERKLREAQAQCKQSEEDMKTEKEHAMQLENDLEKQSNLFYQGQEDFKAELEEEQRKNEELEEKVKTMAQQLKRLKCVDKNLRKTDDQLWRIHEKLEKDEEHDLLLEEVELLRQRVKDMEEGEKIYTQAQEDCKDIKKKLEEEITQTRSLRSQLKTLQAQVKNQKDLQRSIEDTDFRFDELQLKFDFEKRKSNDMKDQLQKMKTRMTDLNDFEKILEESEKKLIKIKEKNALLINEKKCSDSQAKFLIDKNMQLKNDLKGEKEKITDITAKLICESKKVLKIKEELDQEKFNSSSQLNKLQDLLKKEEQKNKELYSAKQTKAEEANDVLRKQVIMLKSRLDKLEMEIEMKDKLIQKSAKTASVAKETNQDIVDIVKSLQAAEDRCAQLTEHLHMKSKVCEDLKRQLSQSKNSTGNNNCILKGVSVENVSTQTIEETTAHQKTPTKHIGESHYIHTSNTVKKLHTSVNTSSSKITSSSPRGPTIKQTNSYLSKQSANKPPVSPSTTLTRSNSGTSMPLSLRGDKKATPNNLNTSSAIEKTFTQEVGAVDSAQANYSGIIKITRDEKTGTPVIKASEAGNIKESGPIRNDNKGINVTNKNSKIPKQPARSIRTFQAKKDFAELQKKWSAKLTK